MSRIWIPEITQPLVAETVVDCLIDKVLSRGVEPLIVHGRELIWQNHQALFGPLAQLGSQLDASFDNSGIYWPSSATGMAAAITALAYYDTGYYQTVGDDSIVQGQQIASQTGGVPEAYAISYSLDPQLGRLMDILQEVPGMHTQASGAPIVSSEISPLPQIQGYGAGLVRLHLQQAL